MNSSTSPSPFSNLSLVIRALRGEVGGWGARGVLSQMLAMLLYRRLGQICGQMERLCLRFQAGRLWRVGMSARAADGARAAEGPGRPGGVRAWPGRFGWLVRPAAYQAAGYGAQLREILGQPEMVALLVAAPQAARILRPLCRMLAVETALLRPGTAVVVPVECEPVVTARLRGARKAVDWGRIALPRGVLSAARRQGRGRVRFCGGE